MPGIRVGGSVVTHITAINVDPIHQSELLQVLRERARFMISQPGFISISLHRGAGGRHVVNYVQWEDKKQLDAAHRAPEFRSLSGRVSALVQDIDSDFYKVVLVEEK
jgi:heme-degrading monooxygenase HmoA